MRFVVAVLLWAGLCAVPAADLLEFQKIIVDDTGLVVHPHCMAAGDIDGARKLFYDWVPYIRYENQPGIGLSIRKYSMMKRGLLDNFATRPPSPSIDKPTQEELDDILSVLPEVPAV